MPTREPVPISTGSQAFLKEAGGRPQEVVTARGNIEKD